MNYIFGTGNFGLIILNRLLELGVSIEAFIDLNTENRGNKHGGLPVVSLDSVKEGKIFIASNRNNHIYLENLIKSNDKLEYEHCDKFLNNFHITKNDTNWSDERCRSEIENYLYLRSIAKSPDLNQFKSIDIVVTEKCTLKCIDCSNLMQYYEEPQNAHEDEIIGAINNLIEAVDYIKEIRIIGGEPLMYKKLPLVLDLFQDKGKYGQIVIFTNGTIKPSQDLLDACKKHNLRFQISDYGPHLSRNVPNLVDSLNVNNIEYCHDLVTRWQNCAKIEKKERSKEEMLSTFSNCCVNDAYTLLNGRLYGCPFAAHADNLKAIPKYANDQIDVVRSSKDEINDFIKSISKKTFYGACNYCNGRDYTVDTVEAAIQTKKPLFYLKLQNEL